ncbi:hypothetical protein D3C75_934690 [compost metagenome]
MGCAAAGVLVGSVESFTALSPAAVLSTLSSGASVFGVTNAVPVGSVSASPVATTGSTTSPCATLSAVSSISNPPAIEFISLSTA